MADTRKHLEELARRLGWLEELRDYSQVLPPQLAEEFGVPMIVWYETGAIPLHSDACYLQFNPHPQGQELTFQAAVLDNRGVDSEETTRNLTGWQDFELSPEEEAREREALRLAEKLARQLFE